LPLELVAKSESSESDILTAALVEFEVVLYCSTNFCTAHDGVVQNH